MKPPPDTKVALYVLHYYMQGLASLNDVVREASPLSREELTYFKLVCQIAFPADVVEEKILPLIGRLS